MITVIASIEVKLDQIQKFIEILGLTLGMEI